MFTAWKNRSMLRAQGPARIALAVLCFVLIATRLGGDHLHFCFDGLGDEPAVSVHLADSGTHHQDGAGVVHDDMDVSLASAASSVHASVIGGDLPSLIFAVFVLLLVSRQLSSGVRPGRESFVTPLSTYRILPPLRAPPR
jgi:hypothetical protein